MSLLLQFEKEYSSLTAEITSKIGRLSLCDKGERRSTSQDIDRLLTEVEDLLDQMELTVRELPSGTPEKGKYELRVRSYRTDKGHLEKELRNAQQRMRDENDREDLFGGGGGQGTSDKTILTEDHKAMLLKNTESLERSSRKLDDTQRMCIETEQIGSQVLNDLEHQRGTINRARERLRDAEEDLGQSSRILSRMIRRVIQNRGILILVGLIIFLVIIVVIYTSIK